MQAIEIKNIGPLVDTGRVPITQVMLLVGEQSTGKSTFMKILCFCSWIEKQIMIGERSALYNYTHYYRFWNELMKFHQLNEDFFTDDSFIKYEGKAVQIEKRGKKRNAIIKPTLNFEKEKHNVKLCFLPAERNLLSSIQNIENLYRSKDIDFLFNFILEWREARANFDAKNPLELVFANHMSYHYDDQNGEVLTLTDKHLNIKPHYASSGVQSALPIQVLASFLAQKVGTSAKISPMEYVVNIAQSGEKIDKNMLASIVQDLIKTDGKKVSDTTLDAFPTLEKIFEQMKRRSEYKSFHLFVEELEQNLFPSAQFELIKLLIALTVRMKDTVADYDSSIFLTTHSPYVLTALNVWMLAAEAYEKAAEKVEAMGLKPYVLPTGAYSAYCIKDGRFENIMDTEYHFIKGDFLDSISEEVDEYTYQLNQLIYGNTEGEA